MADVFVNRKGPYRGLVRRLERQKDRVVSNPALAEVIIPDPAPLSSQLPHLISDEIGDGPAWTVSRWFGGEAFDDQAIAVVPLHGMMNGNLGAEVITGCSTAFIEPDVKVRVFEDERLLELLVGTSFRGFISVRCLGENVTRIETGVPWHGLYAICESIDGKLSSFFSGRSRGLLPCWSGALLLSRYPFPAQEFTDVPSYVEGLTSEAEKHLWLFEGEPIDNTVQVFGTEIAVATAWSKRFHLEVGRRILFTLGNLRLDCKQYRTDLGHATENVWTRLLDNGHVTLSWLSCGNTTASRSEPSSQLVQ